MAQSMITLAKAKVAEFQLNYIRWKPPTEDWVNVSLDGSVFNNNSAAYGGLVQDRHGRFLLGYSANLGLCSIMVAELWGMLFGLKVAQYMGKTKIILEMDSLCVLQLCLYTPIGTHSCSPLISTIRNLCVAIGEVQIIHQFREAMRTLLLSWVMDCNPVCICLLLCLVIFL